MSSFCPVVISWFSPVLSNFGCPFLGPASIPLPSSFFFLLTDKELGLARAEEPRPGLQSRKKQTKKQETSLVGKKPCCPGYLWMLQPVLSRVHSLAPGSPGPISQGCVGQCARMLSVDTSCSGEDPHPHPSDDSEPSKLFPLPAWPGCRHAAQPRHWRASWLSSGCLDPDLQTHTRSLQTLAPAIWV